MRVRPSSVIRRLVLGAALCGFTPAALAAQTATRPAPAAAGEPTPAEIAAGVDSLAASLTNGQIVGMAVVVARGPEPLLAKGYGLADREAQQPVTAQSVFQIGSVTKQFTAAAILRLVEQGRVSLDDPITKYLPDFPTQGHTVTVRHLLNHTSGIRSYTSFMPLTDSMPVQQIYDSIKVQPFDFAPGTDYRYNNSGYVLLGMILEQVTGTPYPELVQEWFFTPLGLDDTRFCGFGGAAIPEGYQPAPGGLQRVTPVDMRVPFSAGALCSTAPDLAKWTWALATGRVLKPETYAMMTAGTTLSTGRRVSYGFGLVADTAAGGRVMIHHGGGIPGFVSQVSYFPADSTTVVVLSNTMTNVGRIAEQVGRIAHGETAPAVQDLPIPAEVRARYAGNYSLTGTPLDIRIFENGDQLMAQATNQPAFRLLWQGGSEFRAAFDTDVRLVWGSDPAGGFTLYQGGAALRGERKE